jgi:hypothetical protein
MIRFAQDMSPRHAVFLWLVGTFRTDVMVHLNLFKRSLREGVAAGVSRPHLRGAVVA